MTESQREYPMGRYPCLVESCTGRIEEKTGTPLMSFVDRKHGNSGLDKLRSALSGGDRILLKDYIQEFLHGDEEYLWSPMNIIQNEYYDSREDVLALRLAELCYHSLTELDEKNSLSLLSNDFNCDVEYFEDAILSLALGAYLAYVHKGKISKSDIPYDTTTLKPT